MKILRIKAYYYYSVIISILFITVKL